MADPAISRTAGEKGIEQSAFYEAVTHILKCTVPGRTNRWRRTVLEKLDALVLGVGKWFYEKDNCLNIWQRNNHIRQGVQINPKGL